MLTKGEEMRRGPLRLISQGLRRRYRSKRSRSWGTGAYEADRVRAPERGGLCAAQEPFGTRYTALDCRSIRARSPARLNDYARR